jgi:hypothetical protein
MAVITNNEKWEIQFESDAVKYTGVATRMYAYDNVFFLVNFHLEDKPSEVFSGEFYPKKELVDTLIIIEWECHTKGIDPKLISKIGSAIEETLKHDNFSVF